MPDLAGAFPTFTNPPATAAAGTPFTQLVPPFKNKLLKVVYFEYVSGATQHTLYAMKPLARYVNVTAAAAGAATSFIVERNPGNYAANAKADGKAVPSIADRPAVSGDWFAVLMPDENYFVFQATGITSNADGTMTIGCPALPACGLTAGGSANRSAGQNAPVPCFWFGLPTDTSSHDGFKHFSFSPTISATTIYGYYGVPVVEAYSVFEPILFYSANATNPGTLQRVAGVYGNNF